MRQRPRLLTVAAPDRAALVRALAALRAMPAADRDAAPARQPTGGRERLAIVAPAHALEAAIDFALERLPALGRPRLVSRPHGLTFASGSTPGRVAFLFPGQGSEYVGMLDGLRREVPLVAGWFDALDQAAVAAGQPPLTALLARGDDPDRARASRALYDMERGAQLGTVADLALHAVVSALGIAADVHLGHSNGEHPAVIASGRVLADRDTLCRGFVALGLSGSRLQRPSRPERLLTIGMVPPDRLEAAVTAAGEGLWLAMENCPTQAVVGGLAGVVDAFATTIAGLRGVAAPLPFERAYHTPLFADWAGAFAAYYDALPLGAARVPVYSCCTGMPLPDAPADCRRTMAAQWTSLVRFRQTVERLHDEGVRTFVEIGPGATLTAFVEDTLRGRPHTAVTTNSPQRDDVEQLLHALGQLFVAGLDVDGSRLDALLGRQDEAVGHVTTGQASAAELAYAADVHRRLIAGARGQLTRVSARVARPDAALEPRSVPSPLLGEPIAGISGGQAWRRCFSRDTDPFVDHHALGRAAAAVPGGYPLPVLAFTVSLEIAAEAARAALGGRSPVEVRDARASRWLALDEGSLDLEAETTGHGPVAVRLREAGSSLPAFEATAYAEGAPVPPLPPLAGSRAAAAWTPRRFYEEYAFHGPAFQGLQQIDAVGPTGVDAVAAVTRLPGIERSALVLDPALLDCAGQLVAYWLLEHEGSDTSFGVFPFRAARLVVGAAPPPAETTVLARARLSRGSGMTRADVQFSTTDGRLLLALSGFDQRIVAFPPAVARRLFGGDPAAVPSPDDTAFLGTSWGIWTRALAHLALGPAERRACLAPGSDDARAGRLLAALGVRAPGRPVPE